MNDLIKRQSLIDNLNHFAPEHYNALVDMLIEKEPAVDAVEVVRCKDCKHMSVEPYGRYCFVWGGYNGMGDDGFCNYGKRKVENG